MQNLAKDSGGRVVDSLVTVFFWELPVRLGRRPSEKIDRLIPIVAETEQIVGHRNWCLKSRAQISDGSAGRFFVVR
jgi:hypothetical protein